MKNTFNISEEEKNRILNLHESYTDSFGIANIIKEGTERWVVTSDGKETVGTFDTARKLKFIPNEAGTKAGYKSGNSIPSGTKFGKNREQTSVGQGEQQRTKRDNTDLNEQDYQISDMLGELTKLYTVTSEHIAFVDKAIECGYEPSAKCMMGSWAQDDECVRESLKDLLEIPETLACIGKSVGQNVKDMIAKLAPQ